MYSVENMVAIFATVIALQGAIVGAGIMAMITDTINYGIAISPAGLSIVIVASVSTVIMIVCIRQKVGNAFVKEVEDGPITQP